MAIKRKQHHCPVCKKIAGPRCATLEHLIHCKVHDCYHSIRSECAQCKDSTERALREERRQSESGSGESVNDENTPPANNNNNNRNNRRKGRKSRRARG